jgi:mono/diheme cytochrome c family protein
MSHAVKALLSLSFVLATAGCATPTPSPAAPPTSLGGLAQGPVPGSHLMPDGSTMMPDGSIVAPDGSTLSPDGTPVQHDPATAPAGGHAGTGGHATPSADDLNAPAKSYRLEVIPILRQHCASCHTAGGAGAEALAMFDAAGEPQFAAIKENIGRMLLEIQSGRMPKGKPNSLSKEEFDVLDLWGAAEMPDN